MTSNAYPETAETPASSIAGQAAPSWALLSQNRYDIVGKLPSEIFSTIFRFSLYPSALDEIFSESLSWHVDPKGPAPTQLNLVAVCHRWREIALTDPHLWNVISIRLNKDTTCSSVSGIKDWVSRSGSLPLSICFDWAPVPGYRDSELYKSQLSIGENLVDTLLTFTSRVAILYLRLPSTSVRNLHQNPSEWPLLKAASIEYISGYGDCEVVKALRFGRPLDLADAPQLQYLRLSSCYLAHVTASWVNVTKFKGRKFSPSECLQVLQAAP